MKRIAILVLLASLALLPRALVATPYTISGTVEGFFFPTTAQQSTAVQFETAQGGQNVGLQYFKPSGGFSAVMDDSYWSWGWLDLGYFRQSSPTGNDLQVYANIPFELRLSFTAPAIANEVVSASVHGVVSAAGGIIKIDFTGSDYWPYHNLMLAGGQTSLYIGDMYFDPPAPAGEHQDQYIYSWIEREGVPVPEPAAFEVIGAGFLGAVLLLRRRSSPFAGAA